MDPHFWGMGSPDVHDLTTLNTMLDDDSFLTRCPLEGDCTLTYQSDFSMVGHAEVPVQWSAAVWLGNDGADPNYTDVTYTFIELD